MAAAGVEALRAPGRHPDVSSIVRRLSSAALPIVGCLLLAGCASVSRSAGTASPGDPFEPANRGLYRVGGALDRAVVRPVAMGYRYAAPRPLRRLLSNILQNLDEPVVFANDLLQGRVKSGARTVVRFAVNSTIGLAGAFDPAASAGVPHHDNTFGDTLGRYGVGPGPYLFVPVLGPSNARDLFGLGVDIALDPLTWARFHNDSTVDAARTVVEGIDDRVAVDHELRSLQQSATDPYATIRSVYAQKREAEVHGGEAPLEDLPAFPVDAQPAPAPAPPAAPPAS